MNVLAACASRFFTACGAFPNRPAMNKAARLCGEFIAAMEGVFSREPENMHNALAAGTVAPPFEGRCGGARPAAHRDASLFITLNRAA